VPTSVVALGLLMASCSSAGVTDQATRVGEGAVGEVAAGADEQAAVDVEHPGHPIGDEYVTSPSEAEGPPLEDTTTLVVADRDAIHVDGPGVYTWVSAPFERPGPNPDEHVPGAEPGRSWVERHALASTTISAGGKVYLADLGTFLAERPADEDGRITMETTFEVTAVDGPGPHAIVISAWYTPLHDGGN
jgi:hypothetical protein